MLVIVSWVSFWLDPNAVPARVSLGVTTLLTMSTQTASINNSLPPVAYTKAIDVWTGVSRLTYHTQDIGDVSGDHKIRMPDLDHYTGWTHLVTNRKTTLGPSI